MSSRSATRWHPYIITAINIIVFLIGVQWHGFELKRALETYAALTIVDGPVTVIPALMISVSGGFIITRTSSDTKLGFNFQKQVLNNPKPWMLASGVLIAMAAFPGLENSVPGSGWRCRGNGLPHAPKHCRQRQDKSAGSGIVDTTRFWPRMNAHKRKWLRRLIRVHSRSFAANLCFGGSEKFDGSSSRGDSEGGRRFGSQIALVGRSAESIQNLLRDRVSIRDADYEEHRTPHGVGAAGHTEAGSKGARPSSRRFDAADSSYPGAHQERLRRR